MSGAEDTKHEPVWKVLRGYASHQLKRLQGGYLRGASASKADLALLRKTDPSQDDRLLLAWEAVFRDPPERLLGRGDSLTEAERALGTALHLYALHQQSRGEPMHVDGMGLGKAIRRLANPSDAESRERPVMRRYHSLTTATDLPEATQHLRGLVRQMRSEGIPLDYAQLTVDLFQIQRDNTRTSVRLRWARDLTRRSSSDTEQETSAPDEAA